MDFEALDVLEIPLILVKLHDYFAYIKKDMIKTDSRLTYEIG